VFACSPLLPPSRTGNNDECAAKNLPLQSLFPHPDSIPHSLCCTLAHTRLYTRHNAYCSPCTLFQRSSRTIKAHLRSIYLPYVCNIRTVRAVTRWLFMGRRGTDEARRAVRRVAVPHRYPIFDVSSRLPIITKPCYQPFPLQSTLFGSPAGIGVL